MEKNDGVQFMMVLVGCNQLCHIDDVLTFDFPLLKEKVLSNKTKRGVGITRMEEALIPKDYGMEMMGY